MNSTGFLLLVLLLAISIDLCHISNSSSASIVCVHWLIDKCQNHKLLRFVILMNDLLRNYFSIVIAQWIPFTLFAFACLGIVNRGDSFRRRRSRSTSLIPPVSPMKAPDNGMSSQSGPADSYLVAMLGAPGVGKCALLSQFRTSECINAYETGRGKY